MKTFFDLIYQLPEIILFNGQKEKAFLEITPTHVYYCTKHDNKGNLSCAFVSCNKKGELHESLKKATEWIEKGIKSGDILVIE